MEGVAVDAASKTVDGLRRADLRQRPVIHNPQPLQPLL